MVASLARSQNKVYKYMQQASRTGILFLVYSKVPTSILYDYSDSMLVLSDSGAVLYYGGSVSSPSSPGSISTSRAVLFDPYFDPQPNYNSMDRVYHLVTLLSRFYAAHLRRLLPAPPAAVRLPQQRRVGLSCVQHAVPNRSFPHCRPRRSGRLQVVCQWMRMVMCHRVILTAIMRAPRPTHLTPPTHTHATHTRCAYRRSARR